MVTNLIKPKNTQKLAEPMESRGTEGESEDDAESLYCESNYLNSLQCTVLDLGLN